MRTGISTIALLSVLVVWASAESTIPSTESLRVKTLRTDNFPVWYATRPLKVAGFNEALFPEKRVDLTAKDSNGRPLWSKHTEWSDGERHGLPELGHASSTYLYRVIFAKHAAKVPVSFGVNHAVEVWLNGQKILSRNRHCGPINDQYLATFDLRAGENQLLVKIFNENGGGDFFFNFWDASTNLVMDPVPLRRAIEDLSRSFPGQYTRGAEFLKRLDAIEAKPNADAFLVLQREALLANPLMNFDRLLMIKRSDGSTPQLRIGIQAGGADTLGLSLNYHCLATIRTLARDAYDNEIATLSPLGPAGKVTTLYKPEGGKFVGEMNLHFDADKILFTSLDKDRHYQVFEMDAAGKNIRQVTPDLLGADNLDACYLPDGRIDFVSTSIFQCVPCQNTDPAGNLHQLSADGKAVRRLTFDQDQNWCPTVLNSGQIMYTRWEYSDSAHFYSRLLFRMNPDGTGQEALMHSNSYWPNATFYAKPIPGSPTKVIGIVSGHHGPPRMGELVLFDLSRGRHESEPAVQRIPGYGKPVKAILTDELAAESWPKFLHPYPLSDKYFLVSAKPNSFANWGIYLVDIFDNMLLLAEQPGYALFEPVPFRKTAKPPVIPDKVNLASKDATLILDDIYDGPGLAGVPRGTVKKLRLYSYDYAYSGMGGERAVGADGPWDIHRILGTVPVNGDGSAMFKVPANTPIAVQPLDADGRALQVMRSWYTAMPGETLSCVGCHEESNSAPSMRKSRGMAALQAVSEITPWHGPARGFSFAREVQPVLDTFCVGCHDGAQQFQGKPLPDLRAKKAMGQRYFDQSYLALMPYVRRPGPESDIHLQSPLEWHASTSELIQMLEKGHHRVQLDDEAWDRLYTWIDLNVPDHGTWTETEQHGLDAGKLRDIARRKEMNRQVAYLDEDYEFVPHLPAQAIAFVKPPPEEPVPTQEIKADGWPFDAAEAKRRQSTAGLPPELRIDLGSSQPMDLVLVPAGEFIMGDLAGYADERPLTNVRIKRPFYMAKCETTNSQFVLYNSTHDSGFISQFGKDHCSRGFAVNGGPQPVVRVSWEQAMAFCAWLSRKTGRKFTLPTEAPWEYACRAGTVTPLNYGTVDTDFRRFANLADVKLYDLCSHDDGSQWLPAITRVDDGESVTSGVGRYQPNAWGLADMHGNAAEWTLTSYQSYPYAEDGRDDGSPQGLKVVRGGSFYDRPIRARSAFRLAYPSWQRVFNVGFRVICEVRDVKQTVIR